MDSKLEQAKEWVDAEKVREAISKILADTTPGTVGYQVAEDYAVLIGELLPTPPLPTLADMSFDELKDYIGEKVTVDGWANPTILVAVIGDEGAVLAHRLNKPWPFVEVRPLSDLAPVAAPEQETENIPELVQPRPEDVKQGDCWLVKFDGHEWVGTRDSRVETVCSWALARLDGADYTVSRDDEITLISRMVLERKENA